MDGLYVWPEIVRNHVAREVWCGRSLHQELVFGEAIVVNVRDGDRRRLWPNARELEACACDDEQTGELASDHVLRKTSQKSGWHSEPGQRTRRVERSSAWRRPLRAVAFADPVDQGFAANYYHLSPPTFTFSYRLRPRLVTFNP